MRIYRLKGLANLICVSLLLLLSPAVLNAVVKDTLAFDTGYVMVSPYQSSEKDLVTSSVSSIGGWELEQLPGVNRTNLLNGRVTGFLGIQSDGSLGVETNSMYIRGLHSLSSSSQQALILVDLHHQILQITPQKQIMQVRIMK